MKTMMKFARRCETCRILLDPVLGELCEHRTIRALLRGEGGILAVHLILKPDVLDGFASVFMASANFEDLKS